MIPPLSPELEQRIEEEAEEAATVRAWTMEDYIEGKENIPPTLRVDSMRKAFFKKGAIPYAELWQEAQTKGQKLADALEWIKTYGPYTDELTVKFIDNALKKWYPWK